MTDHPELIGPALNRETMEPLSIYRIARQLWAVPQNEKMEPAAASAPPNAQVQAGRYQHYKKKDYDVLGVAFHQRTHEELVIYKALYAADYPMGQIWAQSPDRFTETVNIDGVTQPRFRRLTL